VRREPTGCAQPPLPLSRKQHRGRRRPRLLLSTLTQNYRPLLDTKPFFIETKAIAGYWTGDVARTPSKRQGGTMSVTAINSLQAAEGRTEELVAMLQQGRDFSATVEGW